MLLTCLESSSGGCALDVSAAGFQYVGRDAFDRYAHDQCRVGHQREVHPVD